MSKSVPRGAMLPVVVASPASAATTAADADHLSVDYSS